MSGIHRPIPCSAESIDLGSCLTEAASRRMPVASTNTRKRAARNVFIHSNAAQTSSRLRSGEQFLFCELVYADVVNEELGREFSVGVRRTGPVPTDGKIKEEVKSLVERCREFAALGGPFRLGLPRLTVDCPMNLSFLPHDGENVKVICECPRR